MTLALDLFGWGNGLLLPVGADIFGRVISALKDFSMQKKEEGLYDEKSYLYPCLALGPCVRILN